MEKTRVIQWTTGKVGKFSLRSIIDDPRLELAGVYAFSPEKVGLDAGELCDRESTGVLATDSVDSLLASGADAVVYTPFTGDVDHVEKLLESGIDVLSTNLFFHVGGIQGDVQERLERACQRGKSSFYVTGINPGWINSIATSMTAVCSRLESVAIYESAYCATYESPETWSYFGMGQHGVTPERIEAAKTWLVMFRDAVVRVGRALGLTFDDIEFYCEHATAAERVDLGWFLLEQGSIAAVRGGWLGKIDGQMRVKGQVTWYMTKKLAEGWDLDEDEYRIVVDGEPGVDTRIRFRPPAHWSNSDWDSLTSAPTVNAILQVKEARPGVLTLQDVGLPYALTGWPMGPGQ